MHYADIYTDRYLDTYGYPTPSALPSVQVLVDWVNNPIGSGATAGSNWTDISAYVQLDQGVNITRGRQDNISTVQPGRCTFTVWNDDGRFTPGNTGSPYSPGVIIGRRVQVNIADETGAYHTRFDGMINEYDVTETPTGKSTLMQLVCIDVLGFLNRYPGFQCWTVEECLSLNPMLMYVMDEAVNSPGLFDRSGNNGPILTPATYAHPIFTGIANGPTNAFLSAPAYTYQSGNSPVEAAVPPTLAPGAGTAYPPTTSPVSSPLPSVQFAMTMNQDTGANTQATAAPSAQFQGALTDTLVVGTDNFTLLGWVWPDFSIMNDAYNSTLHQIICLSNSRSGSMLSLQASTSGGNPAFRAGYYANYPGLSSVSATSSFAANAFYLNAPFMVAVVVSGTTATFYLSGNILGIGATLMTGATTVTVPSGVAFDYLSIGGPLSGGNGFAGNISLVNVYDTALNPTQLLDLGTIGAQGVYGQTMNGAVTRAASTYTGLPSYWQGTFDTGLSFVDYLDITGSSPAAALQSLQQAERGLLFTDASGKLNFHDRSRRMGAAAPAVTLPAGSYNTGIQPKINDQYLINSEALQNQRSGLTVVAQDAASIAKYGNYPNGTLKSPQTGPYITWAGNTTQHQVASPGTGTVVPQYGLGSMTDTANWDVNTLSEPAMKLATPTVNMLGNNSGQSEYVAPSTLYGIEINQAISIGQTLTWWPNGPESSELFVEGVTETYSTGDASIGFYTSPAFQGRGWLPGNSTYGKIDSTARIGISKASSSIAPLYDLPVSTFGTSMNLGAGTNGFIGESDIRGLWTNLQQQLQPPILFVDQVSFSQSLTSGTSAFLVFDSMLYDSHQMMNQYVNANTAAVIPFPGWYEVCATAEFASNATGVRTVWITQNQTGALRNIAPASCRAVSGTVTGLSTSAVIWCNAGDAIAVSVLQNSGSTISTATANGGSELSIRFIGAGSARN